MTPPTTLTRRLALGLAVCWSAWGPAYAAEDKPAAERGPAIPEEQGERPLDPRYALCETYYPPPPSGPEEPRADQLIHLYADEADFSEEGLTILRGDVFGRRGDQELRTEELRYDHDEERAETRGPLSYRDRRLVIEAERARVELDGDTSRMEGIGYRLRRSRGHGHADAVSLTGREKAELEGFTYTTCDPHKLDWQLKAGRARLNHDTGVGTARNVTMEFKGVPVAYLPWATFPIDDRRKSGFLLPTLGSASDNGLDISVPYYWNIAPNMDATFSPRFIAERGLMLGTQYRYLFRGGHTGTLGIDYLPGDDRKGEDRALFTFDHLTRLGGGWLGRLDLNRVTDDEYFEDFGDSLDVSATTFLRSRAGVSGRGDWWDFSLEADDFQTLDELPEDREPYSRLPRALYTLDVYDGPLGLSYDVRAEAVNFERDFGVTGGRLDVYPRVSLPVRRPSWFLEPSVGYRLTGYTLDGVDDGDETPTRELPVVSLDGGLFFERSMEMVGKTWLQTLEPRFFYLFVPNENQNALPTFDTAELDFELGQLFRSNRFSGADRQGDANRIALAVTSRVLEAGTGREVLSARIGQIYHFSDRQVQIDAPTQTDAVSPIITELSYQPATAWTASMGLHWDPNDDEADKAVARLQHADGEGRLINLSYRFRRGRVEQTDVSAVVPLTDRWKLIGRWNYSLREKRSFEKLLGFQYDSCCWALRLVGREHLSSRDGDTRATILLQIELKGLGNFGQGVEGVLRRGILGY